MSRGFLALLVFGVAVTLPLGAWFGASLAAKAAGDPEPSLAARINGACVRPGYRVADWTTGDEWHPLPAGVVQVRCEGPGGYADSYYVAVAR